MNESSNNPLMHRFFPERYECTFSRKTIEGETARNRGVLRRLMDWLVGDGFTDEDWKRIKEAKIRGFEYDTEIKAAGIRKSDAETTKIYTDVISAEASQNYLISLLKQYIKSFDYVAIRPKSLQQFSVHDVIGIHDEAEAYQRLKDTKNLPTPSDKAFKIYHLANDDNASMGDIASLVETDPAISARIIKMANSAFYYRLEPVSSVQKAISRLGLKMLKKISLYLSLIQSNKNGVCEAFDYDLFWSESLARAVAASIAAVNHRKTRGKENAGITADEAFTLGLLCQIGRLAFAAVEPDRYTEVLTKTDSEDYESLLINEKKAFGLNHNELAADMMADWNLPGVFCNAVRFQKSPDYMKHFSINITENELINILHQDWHPYLLKWTGTISAIMTQPGLRREKFVLDHSVNEARYLGIHSKTFSQKFDCITKEWIDIGKILTIKTHKVPSWQKIYAEAC
ncbi:MAG: HDOD domain-containing protein [Sedimentisphaerales bacterium]|nr:HDOD domain-containing protein [Sedimentisphaerales bacterium]